jgi:hypothetical protein
MRRDLVKEIVSKTKVAEAGLRVTLSRIKRRRDLKSIQQAACFYIKKKMVPINVSSIIDDTTREAVKSALTSPAPQPPPQRHARPRKAISAPKVKWLPARHYTIAGKLSDFYPYIFVFENALRAAINARMSAAYGPDWWQTKIRVELSDAYKYAEDEEKRQSKLPIVGMSLKMSPLELVTIGHLEQIIQKYQKLFVPSLFPTFHFFSGHMVIVKQVRNAMAHVSPSATPRDIQNARHEMSILLQHLSSL